MANSQFLSYTLDTGSGSLKVTDATTRFVAVGGTAYNNATEANIEAPIRDAGTFSNLYTRVTQNDIASATSATFTLSVSRVASALTVSYGTSQTGVKEDTTHSVSVANTDEVSYKIVATSVAGTHGVTYSTLAMQFASSTAGNSTQVLAVTAGSGATANFSTASTTNFAVANGIAGWRSSNADTDLTIRSAGTLKNFYILVSANARTTDTVLGSYVNGANGGQSVTYTSGQTGAKEDAVNTDTLAAGDTLSYRITTSTGTQTISATIVAANFVGTAGKFPLANMTGIDGIGIATSQTVYYPLDGAGVGGSGSGSTTESDVQLTPRFTTYLSNLAAYCIDNTLTSTTVIRTRDGGANGAQSLTYTSGQSGLKTDTVNSDTITSATDAENYQLVTGGTGVTFNLSWIAVWGSDTAPASGGSATLTVGQGSYSLTGQTVNLLHARLLTAAQGAYTYTGQDVALTKTIPIVIGQGSYTLTGQSVATLWKRILTAAQGSYAYTGQDVALSKGSKITVEQGSYTYTGQSITTLWKRVIAIAQGSYALTGQNVALLRKVPIVIAQGAYSYTGQAVNLLWNRLTALAQGSYSLTGQDVTLTKTGLSQITVGQGSYTYTGQAINLVRSRIVTIAQGTYSYIGQAVDLILNIAGITPGSNVSFVADTEIATATKVFVTTDQDGTATAVKSVQVGGTKVLSLNDPAGATKIRVVQ